MLKKSGTIFIVLVLTFSLGRAQSNDLQFRTVSPPGGFTHSSVKAIAEDRNGFIWFGTDHGLFMRNTVKIQKYIHQQGNLNSIPDNNIYHIFKDQSGKLWVSTSGGLCSFDENKQNFRPLKFKGDSPNPTNEIVREVLQNKNGELFALYSGKFSKLNLTDSISETLPLRLEATGDVLMHAFFDSSNNLWIGTNRGYVYNSRPPYQNFRVFCHLRDASVRCLCIDNNTLWIGYEWGGADHINEQGLLIEHYDQKNSGSTQLPHNRVRQIIKDPENRIWIATYNGILIVDKNNTQAIRKDQYNKLPHNSIYSVFVDSRKGIWIGTWSGGLAYQTPYDNQFLHFDKDANAGSLSNNVVSSFAEEPDGTIWVGTESGVLNRFNRKDKSFTPFVLQRANTGTSNIKCMAFDHENRLWLGTLSNGLWYFDQRNLQFKQLDIFDTDIVNLYAVLPDENGLWLGTYGTGLFYYDFSTKKKTVFTADNTDPNAISSNQIRVIMKDSYGGLWVGTHAGLNYKPKGSNNFTRYYYNNTEGQHISSNEIFAIQEDASGKIWIGTGGGGVDCYAPTTRQFTNLSPKDGLSGYNVYGIQIDNKGNLWFSTDNGISCYYLSDKIFRNYSHEDGLQGDQFNPGAAYKCRDGSMLFGGPNGFNLFSPEKIVANPVIPQTIITDFSVNNKKNNITNPESPVHQAIQSLQSIQLKHFQNSLIFEFVTNNYIQPQKNQFRYRLLNYENNWQEAGNEGRAIFTKVPPGKYTLEVIGSNNDGLWTTSPTRLEVTIRPPFWLTWYAYTLYLLLVAAITWSIRKEVLLRKELKNQLLLERVQRENEEKLHQMKLQFFTNISHDFRTPLTLILSPLENLLTDEKLSVNATEQMGMIQRNAKRLRRLIDQLLDFRKLEFNKATYIPANADIVDLCRNVCNDFDIYARNKSIAFSFESVRSKIKMKFDSEKMDKVIFNLLANAFKYTPENGSVSLSIEETAANSLSEGFDYSTDQLPGGKVIAISIKDNGPGIRKEELPMIFERFYQTPDAKSQGTGIGLHLCLEYVRMHQGSILVKSEPGQGTTFTVLLPLTNKSSLTGQQVKQKWEAPLPEAEKTGSGEKQSHSILIVEDNLEIQKYLRQLLSDEYRVLVAGNGTQGLEMANELYPDLIISDIMMPGIDGFDLCQRIKEDSRTSHIPVILLTALSDTSKRISGLKTGANAYLTKPFDNNLLKAQIINLLDAQKRMQKTFIESQEKWEEDSNLMPTDKRLMEKAIAVVEKHLLDENFSVEQLADELSMSRSSLHRKMRALTNQSATEFIRYVRLKKAIKLMKEGSYNIDEVGYAVGFNSHSYFTQCFKKQFDKTPSAYLSEIKRSKNEE
jgi:signal transduction histidine kinase/ligand-binding sensor domain-containing protein/DNA-binding response OmpR family regulator